MSPADASSSDGASTDVGVRDELGARGGDGGDGLGDWFVGECVDAGLEAGIGAGGDNGELYPSWGIGDGDIADDEDWEMENPTKETTKSKTT